MQQEKTLPDDVAPTVDRSFLVRLWTGDVPLPVTYWIFYVLGFGPINRIPESAEA